MAATTMRKSGTDIASFFGLYEPETTLEADALGLSSWFAKRDGHVWSLRGWFARDELVPEF